ncbi:MAG: hypothetical protein KF830_12940 [Planctomycetes bacterium]|nr:hypothetical protein [Planctomycetota bacterium]
MMSVFHRPTSALTLGLLAAAATPLAAQNLSLDKQGGALGAVTTFPIQGQPNEFYALAVDLFEQSTALPQYGVTMDLPLLLVDLSFALPGWVGLTNGAGVATPAIVIPDDPFFEQWTYSLQVLGGGGPWRVSNLVRVTPQHVGTWKPALNQPPVPIAGGTTAAAPNNELLFVGGSGPVAQRYKSRTEEWEAAGVTFGVGLFSQSTGLPDGRVLFTGGLDPTTGQTTANAAVYDPATQTTTTLTMAQARAGHGASLMGNGKVLVTGGLSALDLANPLSLFTGLLVTTEIFDPATNAFSPGPNMLEARALHTSTTLTNGQVLVAGGISLLPIVNLPTVSATAYRFNPTTNSFGLPAFFSGGRFLHSAVATTNGRVVLIGGLNLDFTTFLTTGNIADLIIQTRTDCQLFTPSFVGGFGTFTTINGMQEGRAGAAAAALPNGRVLIAGGFQLAIDASTSTFGFNATASADLLSQGPNNIVPTGSMAAPRLFPTTVNLPDGTVMVVGGGPTDAEIYQN